MLNIVTLASGPLLASGTFWAGVGVAVAIVAAVVPVILWSLGSPRRLLVYNMDSDTALLSSGARERAGADVRVTVNYQLVNDPHVVVFRLESRSRRDVRPADFVDGRPVKFDMAVPVIRLLDSYTGGESLPEVKLAVEGSHVVVGPSLIKSRQSINLTLLTDGAPTVTCPRPSLTDVIVRRRPTVDEIEPRLRPLRLLVAVGFLVGGALAAAGKFVHSQPMTNIGAVVLFAPLFALIGAGIIGLIVTSHRGGWMRGPQDPTPEDSKLNNRS